MKRTIFIISLLATFFSNAQVFTEGIVTGPMTTTEINALSGSALIEGRQVYNSTTKTIWFYDGSQWVDSGLSSGTAYTFGTGLTESGGTVTVNNAELAPAWANITGIPADIADGDDDTVADGSETVVNVTSPVTISGTGTSGSPYQIGIDLNGYLIDGSNTLNQDLVLNKPSGGEFFINDNQSGFEYDSSLGVTVYAPSDGVSEDGYVALISEENSKSSGINVFPNQIAFGTKGTIRYELQDTGGNPVRVLTIDSLYNNSSDVPTKADVDAAIAAAGGDPDQTLSIGGSESDELTISGAGGNTVSLAEGIQDNVGNMVVGNTETGIDVTYDDVAGKLNFNVTAGGTTPAPSVVEMTDGVAPTTAHISNPTNGTVNIINSTSSDKTIPLNNLNVGTINDSFFIGDRNTAGVTRVQEGTMTFADTPDKDGDSKGSNNTIEITDNAYVFFNEDIDGNPLPEGNFDWVTISSCTPDPNELFTTANAASDPNCNEANGTSGITNDAGTLTVSTSEVNVGTYALQHVAGAANGHRFRISFNVTNGNTYTFSWDEYQSVGTDGIVHTVSGAGNVTGEPSFRDIATGGWTSDSVVMTATATGTVEIAFYSANGGASGDTIHIDNISIIEN